MAPRKVSIFADADQIKNIYADETSVLKPCTTCSFTVADNGIQLKRSEAKKLKSIVSRRVTRFYQLFQPMLDFLLVNRYALFNKQKKMSDAEMIPTDHIIVVHLADLPNDADADQQAVRPHLRIDKLEPRAVSDLSEEEKATLHKEWSAQRRPEEYRISHLVSYKFAEGHTWTTIRTSSYDFNPLIVGRVNNRVLMERLIAFAQGINEIANGSRPDLYEMIRNQIKETRKQEVGVSLSTLLVKEGRGGGGGATNSMLW